MVGAWQDGELRVGESFSQGEGVLYGDLLVAIANHDERRPRVTHEVGDREGRLLAMHTVELLVHNPEVLPPVGGDGTPVVDEERQRLVVQVDRSWRQARTWGCCSYSTRTVGLRLSS